ncbi:MAG: Hsp20/alpha crystallin family protein [Planctomycetaceae bacterium]
MRCNVNSYPVSDPFQVIRREFERRVGLPSGRTEGLRVVEVDSQIHVILDLPGVAESDVDITVHDGVLNISAERKSNLPEQAKVLITDEPFGTIQRTLKLHDAIDPNTMDAVLENGVLTVTMSRRPELQPRKVTVRPASQPTPAQE